MKMPATQIEFVAFDGGLDLITPPLQTPSGRCRDAQNFEVDTLGGYSVSKGYERFDGRPSPSLASYVYIPATVTTAFPVRAAVTGSVSGATGVVAYWVDGTVIVTKVAGNFQNGETLNHLGSPYATVTGVPTAEGGPVQSDRARFYAYAADVYRTDIAAAPGTGAIRGLVYFEDILYAFRNGGSGIGIYKSSGAGWTAVPLGHEISFTNAGLIEEGGTLTQGGNTALVRRVILTSGTLGGTNTGRLVLSGLVGSFSAGAATITGISLTLGGAQTAIVLANSGRFRFVKYNFGNGYRVYGCDGVNQAFEFDGTCLAPIRTGMPTDNPTHVAAHKNHLFLTFDASLQFSGIGNPFSWSPLFGAGELNLGDTITNLLPMPGDNVAGGAMACFTRQRTYLLYGNSSGDFQLVTQRDDTGAIAHTAQFVDTCYVLDNRGVTSLQATDAFGNFASSSLSQLIRPWVMENKTRALDSCVVRDKNQYRLLFAGGRVLTMTMRGNQQAGFMPLLLKHNMTLLSSFDADDGTEVIFYGDNEGMVYQADVGTSHDGQSIDAFMTMAFNHSKSPRALKQYRKVVFEIGGTGYAEFFFAGDLAYMDVNVPQIESKSVSFGDNSLGETLWDSGAWDSAVWDGAQLLPAEHAVEGVAQNIALRVLSSSTFSNQITFYGALLHFTPRRQMR